MAPNDEDLYIGQRLDGRFQVTSFIAPGGFSLVFEAEDSTEKRTVALKILSQNASTDGRIEFETEKELLLNFVKSSNIITTHGNGEDMVSVTVQETGAVVNVPVHYIVLELADACLADLVVSRQRLSWEDRLSLFRGVVKGIHQMHLAAMVHRDIKSENVLIVLERSGAVQTKVADLGRSRLTTTQPRFLVEAYEAGRGDLRFAPPELLWLLGRDDPLVWRRVDYYLLGSVFFELATGQALTSMALRDPFQLLARARRIPIGSREGDFATELQNVRAQYEFPYSLFETELPPSIRFEGKQLLRRLTDPDPERRKPMYSRRQAPTWSLEWLLKRIDIMQRQLRTSAGRSS